MERGTWCVYGGPITVVTDNLFALRVLTPCMRNLKIFVNFTVLRCPRVSSMDGVLRQEARVDLACDSSNDTSHGLSRQAWAG